MFFLFSFIYFTTQGNAAPLLFKTDFISRDSCNQQCVHLDQRSLLDILWSCLVTIFACSWVSVHPNVPAPKEGHLKIAMRRLELMFWAIITPELIIYWAMRQWIGARQIEKVFRGKPGWSRTHSHFLQMGGFILYKDGQPVEILSCEKTDDLFRDGRIDFSNVTADEIKDRSKGDALSKTLVLCQTLWFIVQCVARGLMGLVITELELVTVAFAFLNAFMYFLWWDKPLDVQSHIAIHLTERTKGSPDTSQKLREGLRVDEDDPDDPREKESIKDDVSLRDQALFAVTSMMKPLYTLHKWASSNIFNEDALTNVGNGIIQAPVVAFLFLFERMGEMTQFGERAIYIPKGQMRVPTFYALMTDPHEENRVILATSIIAVAFGAIHCAGWSRTTFVFPSHVESLTWKISSLVITVIPLLMSAAISFNYLRNKERGLFYDVVTLWRTEALFLMLSPLVFYVLARFVLIVLAFLGLRGLTPGALSVVNWTNFFPHIH